MTQDHSREAFEKWAGIGADYVGSTRHAQWLAWKARDAEIAELVKALQYYADASGIFDELGNTARQALAKHKESDYIPIQDRQIQSTGYETIPHDAKDGAKCPSAKGTKS